MRQKRQTDVAWRTKWKKRERAGILVFLLVFLPGLMFAAIPVQAAAGVVYSCTINRCYAHPVTGLIEDSGGQASYVTGQGMVEGMIYSTGIMEVTDSGAYYLTFRVSLVDSTSNHSFSVQNVGDSEWSEVTPTVTANGSDSNGTTADLCIQTPSENCVVRGSMYVTPMGRDVIFYFYPNNYTEGNSTDMTASIVTESVSGGNDTAQPDADSSNQETPLEESGEYSAEDADRQLESSIEQAAAPAPAEEDALDAGLSNAQGLSLSTAADAEEKSESSNSNISIVDLIVAVTASITLSGLILMTAAAVIVCYFRKNWRRWGGYDNEECDEEDERHV